MDSIDKPTIDDPTSNDLNDDEVIVGGNDQFAPVNRIERDNSNNEEIATEMLLDERDERRIEDLDDTDVDQDTRMNSIVGWSGLILSALSFFILPIVLGAAGIVVGFIARHRDASWLGNAAIIAGVISIIISLFFIPFR